MFFHSLDRIGVGGGTYSAGDVERRRHQHKFVYPVAGAFVRQLVEIPQLAQWHPLQRDESAMLKPGFWLYRQRLDRGIISRDRGDTMVPQPSRSRPRGIESGASQTAGIGMQRAAHFLATVAVQGLVPGEPAGTQKQDIAVLEVDLLRSSNFLQQRAID